MSKTAQLIVNPVVAEVRGVDDVTRLALSNAMGYVVDGFEHTSAGQSGWDGRSTLYDWRTNRFPAGFAVTAQGILRSAGFQIQLIRKPLPEPLGPLPTQEKPLVDEFGPDDRYDYQFKAVSLLEKHGSYIARCATGAGKSRLARLCIKRIGRKTLFLTTRTVLLYQMGEALVKSGFKISYVGDSEWDTSGDVVLGMTQTLSDRLTDDPKIDSFKMSHSEVDAARERWKRRRDEAIDFLKEIEFVIGEEAHEAGGQGYFQTLKHCRRAPYRLALTATPMMRDGESNMRLVGMFGPIRLDVSEEMLIDRGILAQPVFKFVETEAPPTLKRSSAWQKAEELGIVKNVSRNKLIAAEAIRAVRWGLPVMILVKRRAHGEVLKSMISRILSSRVDYIFGDSNKVKRDKALADLKSGALQVLIGSTILDVGVDVPAVGMLILAGGGKAEVAHRQRIGRGLRAKQFGPNICFVLDFIDRANRHLLGHSKQRRAIVEQTQGFSRGILKKGEDFDFAGLGFQRPALAA